MVSSNCTICGGKKAKFIKDQEDSGLLIGNNSPFKVAPLLNTIL